MGKILNINDYGVGYDQGRADGWQEGYDAAVAEIRTMEARVTVATRKVDERGQG